MGSPNVLVLPYPAQGHVNSLMHFSQNLAKQGFRITFVNTESNHKRVVNALAEKDNLVGSQIDLVSIPDGLGPEDDRNDLGKLTEAILRTMPTKLEELIQSINGAGSDGDSKITCIVADMNMGWAMEVADKIGIKGAVLWPMSAAVLGLVLSIPRLTDEGIINSDGFPTKRQEIQLLPDMPPMDTANIPWSIGDSTAQKIIFHYILRFVQALKLTKWWLCNTVYELEPAVLSLVPNLLPIGPLPNNNNGDSVGQFWAEDSSCLNWLDQHPPCSVIYIAFGSFTVYDRTQFQELALGIEATGRSFLWVVRPGMTDEENNAFPDGFEGSRGKIVGWAPQKKVLSHPATACFVSHCGWNSTIEGLSNGVPFLCWPYFADQYFNRSYICDVWKNGLKFDPDQNGIISREEFKEKVEQLLCDENIRARSLELKKVAMNNITEGGLSTKNFENFIEWLKD